MNRLIPIVVRALSLVAAVGITALIIFVHAADRATLGGRDITASRTPVNVPHDVIGAQPTSRLALPGKSAG